MHQIINLKPSRVLIFLLALSFGFFLIDIFLTYLGYRYFLWHSSKSFVLIHKLFALSIETSIPNLFSALNLLLSSILLWVLSKNPSDSNRVNSRLCLIMSIVLLFLAVDDASGIHETIGAVVYPYFKFPRGHALFYAWVIPYTVGALIFIPIFLKFISALPKKIMLGALASVLIFIIAGLGLEFIESFLEEEGKMNFRNFGQMYDFNSSQIMGDLQELLEMVAISFFNYVLLRYISMQKIKIEFSAND